MKGPALSILIAVALGAGCGPVARRESPPPSERVIVGWRLVNRSYKDLPAHRMAGDARVPGQASALVFEPVYSDEDSECDPDEFVRLEVVSGKTAHVGELVTARISIPNAGEDARHLVEVRVTNPWTQVEGPSRLVLQGPEVKIIRFTSSVEGKAGIRVSARPWIRAMEGETP